MKRWLGRSRQALHRLGGHLPAGAAVWLRYPDVQKEARRVAVALGSLAAANLVVFLFLTQPLYLTSRVRVSEWEAMERRLDSHRRSVERMEQQLERLERQEQNLAHFYDVILAEKLAKMTAIQREIRSIASQFQINPESISYEPTYLEGEDLVRFDIAFPLRGSYENLRHFLHRVENSEHFLILDDIALADAREGGVQLSLTVRIHTLFKDREFTPEKGRRS